jgi:mRNA-degrading endonuclease RelE of RelBE toxin-antitoxin system
MARVVNRSADIRQALEGIDLPSCARDGDCLPVSGAIHKQLRERGFNVEIAYVSGMMGENLIGWLHQVVLVDGRTVVDATATQYDQSLPALIITDIPSYEAMMQRATGVQSVTVGRIGSKTSASPPGLDWCKVCGQRIRQKGGRWVHLRLQPNGEPHDHSAVSGGIKKQAARERSLADLTRAEFDSKRWLYHGTNNRGDLEKLLIQGIRISNVPMNLNRRRWQSGDLEGIFFQPGVGVGMGLYVSASYYQAQQFGRNIVAIEWLPGDRVEIPPEHSGDPLYKLEWALKDADGALLASDVPASRVYLVKRDSKFYDNDPWERAQPNYKRGMAGVDPGAELAFKDRLGKCYELAGRYATNNRGAVLVHGSIQGFDHPRIGHAWVIDPDGEVFEPTSGLHWDPQVFESFYRPKEIERYDEAEARVLMFQSGHWGPWHQTPYGLGNILGGGKTSTVGLWWRMHPAGRPFTDATSTPFMGGETKQGLSCFSDPWQLWSYLLVNWALRVDDDVIAFRGTRVGEGNDGEDLVMPQGEPVRRYSWAEFQRHLLTIPFPPRPWRGTWKRLMSPYAKGNDPVIDHVLQRYAAIPGLPRATATIAGDGSGDRNQDSLWESDRGRRGRDPRSDRVGDDSRPFGRHELGRFHGGDRRLATRVKVKVDPSARADYRALDPVIRRQILLAVKLVQKEGLTGNVKALKVTPLLRQRVGDYRLFYERTSYGLRLTRISHRSVAYRRRNAKLAMPTSPGGSEYWKVSPSHAEGAEYEGAYRGTMIRITRATDLGEFDRFGNPIATGSTRWDGFVNLGGGMKPNWSLVAEEHQSMRDCIVAVEQWIDRQFRGSKQAMPWTPGPDESDRCTQSVLMQFGIFGECPKTGLGLLEVLMKHGWTYRAVEVDGQPFRGTVKQFYDRFKEGKFYIASSGHAMAMIDGLLIDSEERGPDGRRIIGAFEVYRKGETSRFATSWRGMTDTAYWETYDVCIASMGGAAGRKQFEIYAHGRQVASRLTLAEAKAYIESRYGPTVWEIKRLPLVPVEHYYWGETTEFTSPTTIWVAELPRATATLVKKAAVA